MKKIIALFLTVLYFSTTNMAFAFSELYYVKNVKKSFLEPIVNMAYNSENFSLKKQDPYLGYSDKAPENYAVVILQQSGENLFYYYDSNNNKKINKDILKAFKTHKFEYERSYNEMHLSSFSKISQKTMVATPTTYSFEEPAQTQVVQKTQTTSNVLKGYVGKIEKGVAFNAYLQTPLNTATIEKGESVVAVLSQNWEYNGSTVAPQGSVLYGDVSKAHPAGMGYKNGFVQIRFNQLILPNGKSYNISTEKIDFSVDSEGKAAEHIKTVAIATVSAAAIACLIALISGGNVAKSAAIGAGVGAVGGGVKTATEKGTDAEIPAYTELELVLDKPLNVVLSY